MLLPSSDNKDISLSGADIIARSTEGTVLIEIGMLVGGNIWTSLVVFCGCWPSIRFEEDPGGFDSMVESG